MRAAKNTGVKGYQTLLHSLITVQKENGHLCSLESSNVRIMSLWIGLMEGNSHSLFLKSGRRKEKKRESPLYGSDSSVSPASLLTKTAFPRKETGYLTSRGFNNLVWHSQWKMWFAGKQWTEHYLSVLVIRESVSGKDTSSKGTFCAALYHNMLGQVGHKVHEIREAHMSGMFYTCISADPTYTHSHGDLYVTWSVWLGYGSICMHMGQNSLLTSV